MRHTHKWATATMLAILTTSAVPAITHDTAPPVLTAWSATPVAPATCANAYGCPTTVTWSGTDDVSGIQYIQISATATSDGSHADTTCLLSPPLTTVTSATCTVTIPRYANTGTWVLSATLYDATGKASICDLSGYSSTNSVAVP